MPDPPVLAKARHLDSEKLASAKNEFAKMEPAGIIRRSSSLWSSPLHMVKIKKSDGSWRSCGDYRRFNTVTVPDRYPLSSVSDFFTKISGSMVFFKLDLQKGYYFGVRNVAQMFQRMMDNFFGDLPF